MNFPDLPAWAVSDEAKAWFAGLAISALVTLTRAGLRWFKSLGKVDFD